MALIAAAYGLGAKGSGFGGGLGFSALGLAVILDLLIWVSPRLVVSPKSWSGTCGSFFSSAPFSDFGFSDWLSEEELDDSFDYSLGSSSITARSFF